MPRPIFNTVLLLKHYEYNSTPFCWEQAPSYASLNYDQPTHLLTGVKCRATSVAKKLIEARLGVSRSIYVNVDTPNLGFTFFNFLGGGELKKPPCSWMMVRVAEQYHSHSYDS